MIDNMDPSLARDLGDPTSLGMAAFMEKLDFCYRNWKRQADNRNRVLDQRKFPQQQRSNTANQLQQRLNQGNPQFLNQPRQLPFREQTHREGNVSLCFTTSEHRLPLIDSYFYF